MHRSARVLVVAVAIAFLAASCGSSASSSSDKPAGNASSSDVAEAKKALAAFRKQPTAADIPLTVALSAKPPKKNVAVLKCEITNCENVAKGLADASKALGWPVEYFNALTTDPAAGWDQALASNPDYVVMFNGLPTSAYSEQLAQAKADKVPVFACYGPDAPTGAAGNGIYSQCGDAANVDRTASIYGNSIIADSGGKAKVLHVYLSEAGSYGKLNDSLKKFFSTKCSGCDYSGLVVSFADIRANKQGDAVVSYLQAHPDVTHIIISFGTAWSGTVDALRTAGLLDSVKLLSNSQPGVPGPFQDLASGDVKGAVIAAPSSQYVSWTEMDAAARLAVGADMAEERKGAIQPSYLVDTQAAAKAWVAKPWEGPAGYQDYFRKLWKVG